MWYSGRNCPYYHPSCSNIVGILFLEQSQTINKLENIKSVHPGIIVTTFSDICIIWMYWHWKRWRIVSDLCSFGANIYDMLKDSFFWKVVQWGYLFKSCTIWLPPWKYTNGHINCQDGCLHKQWRVFWILNRYLSKYREMEKNYSNYELFCRDFSIQD